MNKSSQSGVGLMEVIIGAGIGALVISGLTVSLRNSSEYQRKTESSIGRSVLEIDLSTGLNCNKTMEGRKMGAPCPKDQWIDLKSANGTVLVKADGSTQKGGWSIRALCRAGSSGSLDIRVAKLSKIGQTVAAAKDFAASNPSWFLRDEVSKQLSYSWSHPKANLQSVCQQWFGGSSSVPSCSPNQVV
jgi:hypothetical protein